jgi:hypothetical protein
VHLEVERAADVWVQGDERRVEAFEVADLQHGPAALGRVDHPVGLFERARDRLLDEDVDARREQRAGDLAVGLCGDGEAHCVHALGKHAPVGRPLGLALGGDAARGLLVDVADAGEARNALGGERRVDARVLPAQVSDADDGRA